MQVGDIISSYNVAGLAQEYVEGTRHWLYDKVEQWLMDFSTRMFMLAAEPGMVSPVML